MANNNDPLRTSHRSDSGWKHCHPMDESNLNTTIYNYYGKVMKGGITRAKEHLMAKKDNVAACTKTLKNVREELWKLYKEKAYSSSINPRYTATNDNHESEDEDEISTTSNDKGRNSGGRKGPMDMFCRNPTATIEKRRKEK